MSVQSCQHCKRPYWRYNGSHPPPGYCSVPCHGARKLRSVPPNTPDQILTVIVQHRATMHQTASILAWFPCDECERLEALYADSIDWHYDRISQSIAEDARASYATGSTSTTG